MTAITTGSVLSANVRVNNFSDADKKYEISADVTIIRTTSEYGDKQIQNGSVSADGKTLATWTHYNNLAIQYQVSDTDEQADILAEVQQFVSAVLTFAENVVLTAKTEEE